MGTISVGASLLDGNGNPATRYYRLPVKDASVENAAEAAQILTSQAAKDILGAQATVRVVPRNGFLEIVVVSGANVSDADLLRLSALVESVK